MFVPENLLTSLAMERPHCIVLNMNFDFAQAKLLRDELLENRKYAAIAGVLALAFFAVTLVGGFILFRRAVNDTRPAVASVVNVPTKVGLLFSYDNASDVLNHIVFFNDVQLEPGPTDNLYYAGSPNGHRVLVVSQGTKTASSDSPQVDIKGTVRALPSASTLKKKWKLSKEELEVAQKEGIYIEADAITARRATPARVARK
jgi:hypothetical protein